MKPAVLTILLIPAAIMAAPEKKPSKPPAPPSVPAASSSGPELEAAIRLRIEVFFKMLKESRVDGAYAKLFEGVTLAKDQSQLLTSLISNTESMIEKCGKIESAALLRVRSAGPTLKEITYVANGQARPVRWIFYAYYADGRWQILDTDVDMELSSFFEPESPEKARRR